MSNRVNMQQLRRMSMRYFLVVGLVGALANCSDEVEVDVSHLQDLPEQEVPQAETSAFDHFAEVDPAKLCSDIQLEDVAGKVVKGTRVCEVTKPACTEVGQTDCQMSDKSLYGLDPQHLKPENIKAGVTVADVTGTLVPDQQSCAEDGASDCITTAEHKAAKIADIKARVLSGQSVGTVAGEFVPDLPAAGSVLAADTVGGQVGSLALCNPGEANGCVLKPGHKAVKPSAIVASDIKNNESINGTQGSFITLAPNCSADGSADCLATGGYVALAKANLLATNLQDGYQILNTQGSVIKRPTDCADDGDEDCVATAARAAIQKSQLSAGTIRKNIQIGGVMGDYPSANFPLTGADSNVADLTSAGFPQAILANDTFEFFGPDGSRYTAQGSADLIGANILTTKTIFAVGGALSASPADCSRDNEQNCVAIARYPAIDPSTLNAGEIRKGVTIGGVQGQYPSAAHPLEGKGAHTDLNYPHNLAGNHTLVFFGADGTAYTVAAAADLVDTNILTTKAIFGVNGSASAAPADCASHNGQGCVAKAAFPSYEVADVTPAVLKANETFTLPSGIVTGAFPSAAAPLAGTPGVKQLTGTNFNSSLQSADSFEFWDAHGTKYSYQGDADFTAANLLETVAAFGVSGSFRVQPAECNVLKTNCVATAARPTYDPAVIRPEFIKKGVKIGLVTGSYPSAATPLAGSSGTADLDPTTFTDQIASASSFEYWDASGVRFTAVGDPALKTLTNIRNGTDIFGNVGSAVEAPADCVGSLKDGCVVPVSLKTLDSRKISAANIKEGVEIFGITGTYPSAGNPLQGATALQDLTTAGWNAAMASNAGFEFWDSAGVRHTATGAQDLQVANLKTGASFYGVAGNVTPTSGDCTAANQTGCTAKAGTFPSYNKAALTKAVIKNGVPIMGISGDYPSAAHPMAHNGHTELGASFNAALASNQTFQYWDSEGNRYERTGDADIVAGHIRTGESVFGVGGTVIPATKLSPWDVKLGVSYKDAQGVDQVGKAKLNCRNMSDMGLSHHEYNDYYRNFDDYNNGINRMPNQNPFGDNSFQCNGEAFEDVSYNETTNSHQDCGTSNDVTCIYEDRITGISWLQAPSNQGRMNYGDAVTECENKVAGGFNDWRLPTQKEALMGYVHGIRAISLIGNNLNIYNVIGYIWTSTSNSFNTTQKIRVEMVQGLNSIDDPSQLAYVHCVR